MATALKDMRVIIETPNVFQTMPAHPPYIYMWTTRMTAPISPHHSNMDHHGVVHKHSQRRGAPHKGLQQGPRLRSQDAPLDRQRYWQRSAVSDPGLCGYCALLHKTQPARPPVRCLFCREPSMKAAPETVSSASSLLPTTFTATSSTGRKVHSATGSTVSPRV